MKLFLLTLALATLTVTIPRAQTASYDVPRTHMRVTLENGAIDLKLDNNLKGEVNNGELQFTSTDTSLESGVKETRFTIPEIKSIKYIHIPDDPAGVDQISESDSAPFIITGNGIIVPSSSQAESLLRISDIKGSVVREIRYYGSVCVDLSEITAGTYIFTTSDGKSFKLQIH